MIELKKVHTGKLVSGWVKSEKQFKHFKWFNLKKSVLSFFPLKIQMKLNFKMTSFGDRKLKWLRMTELNIFTFYVSATFFFSSWILLKLVNIFGCSCTGFWIWKHWVCFSTMPALLKVQYWVQLLCNKVNEWCWEVNRLWDHGTVQYFSIKTILKKYTFRLEATFEITMYLHVFSYNIDLDWT